MLEKRTSKTNLFDPKTVFLTSLHITRADEAIFKALNKEGQCFKHLRWKFANFWIKAQSRNLSWTPVPKDSEFTKTMASVGKKS